MARWRQLLRSVRGQAVSVNLVISAAVLALTFTLVVMHVRHDSADQAMDRAARTARVVGVYLYTYPAPDPIPVPSDGAPLIQVIGSGDGRVIAASPALKGKPRISTLAPAANDSRVDGTLCEPYFTPCGQLVALRIRTAYYRQVIIYAAAPLPFFTGWVLPVLLAVLFLTLLTCGAVSTWRTVGRALRPVEAIRSETAEITETGLDRRITVPDTGDEVARLADTMNSTLDRLEHAATNQRQFVSDASHELRSPLTGLRTRLELALSAPEDEPWGETARAALRDVERLQEVVDDLLELARLDAGALASRVKTIDLGELTAEEIGRRARRVPITAELAGDVIVQADPLKMARLLTNLLANAERHADEEVVVKVAAEGKEAVLEVIDDGEGIEPADRERVFDRFTRLDASRSRDAGGSGLGLSISREIAMAYGGRLYLADSHRGARFVLRLPLAGAADGADGDGGGGAGTASIL
ncbi:sensor histidine kinase [Streptosporangium sp. NPDC000396]|uniref:sensor histidine kinase n=1 Tax=Streptosporangium sp. NPDC000396 TaxID=3366185 RepID=UPI00368BD628